MPTSIGCRHYSTYATFKQDMRNTNSRGFTIVELLVVIVVIGLLAAVTIVAFNGVQQRARDSRRESAMNIIKKTMEMYKLDNGQYPYACSNNPSLDCPISSVTSYLSPAYTRTISVPEDKTGVPSMYYAQANSYTIVIPYESKAPCKAGVNPRSDYKTEYPLCT